VIICPVPDGKGISSAEREKCVFAKCRGVEKCSGTNPIRRGLWDAIMGNVMYGKEFTMAERAVI